MPKIDRKYTLRPTQQGKEMAFMTIIDGEIGWHATRGAADDEANQALLDAKNGHYEVTVYVAKCLMQNGETP